MSTSKLKELWKRDYFQTAVMIVIILVAVLILWFGSQTLLGTPNPALAVASGSMCKVQHMSCDGWSHPFERTLHTGDLIIVQGINPKDVKTAADPEGDIIIFHKPLGNFGSDDELIVHRAIENATHNGLVYFRTKGDGNYGPDNWGDPSTGSGDYRGENYTWNNMISEKLLVGKVVLRIPWLGHLALFMRDSSAIYLVMALIVILIIVEFVIPAIRSQRTGSVPKESNPQTYD